MVAVLCTGWSLVHFPKLLRHKWHFREFLTQLDMTAIERESIATPGGILKLTLTTSLLLLAFIAKADSIAYEVASSRDFGTVDLNTGAYTEIGNTPNLPVIGLGELGSTLYTVSNYGGATLYSVNTATGNFTAIGNGLDAGPSASFSLFGSTTTGLYAVSGNGGYDADYLYSLNPITGVATQIGLTVPGSAQAGAASLSNGGASLYLSDGSYLYLINPATGGYTLIGNSSPFESNASTFENGTLYGTGDSPCCSFYSLNTSTASATFVSNETNGPTGGLVVALAPAGASVPAVPEPASFALLGAGILVLGTVIRRRVSAF